MGMPNSCKGLGVVTGFARKWMNDTFETLNEYQEVVCKRGLSAGMKSISSANGSPSTHILLSRIEKATAFTLSSLIEVYMITAT